MCELSDKIVDTKTNLDLTKGHQGRKTFLSNECNEQMVFRRGNFEI